MDSDQRTFLNLPLAVRRHVYRFAAMPDVIYFDNRTTVPQLKVDLIGGSSRQSLWLTCRQIRRELETKIDVKDNFDIQVMGMANLAHVSGRMPACMDFGQVKEVYLTLTPCRDFSVAIQAQWLIDNGMGITGTDLLCLMPNLEIVQLEVPLRPGQVRDRLKDLMFELRGTIPEKVHPLVTFEGSGELLKVAILIDVWLVGDGATVPKCR